MKVVMEYSNAQEQLHVTHLPPQGLTGTVPTTRPGNKVPVCAFSGFLAGRDRVWICRAKCGR